MKAHVFTWAGAVPGHDEPTKYVIVDGKEHLPQHAAPLRLITFDAGQWKSEYAGMWMGAAAGVGIPLCVMASREKAIAELRNVSPHGAMLWLLESAQHLARWTKGETLVGHPLTGEFRAWIDRNDEASVTDDGSRDSIRKRIFERDGGKCRYCFVELTFDGHWHIDHVMPSSRGGSSDPDNLALACPTCNIRKSNRTPDEFFAGVKIRRRSRPVMQTTAEDA